MRQDCYGMRQIRYGKMAVWANFVLKTIFIILIITTMKKTLRILGLALLSFLLIVAIAATYFTYRFKSQAKVRVELTPANVEIPNDSISVERGRVLSVGCRSCHGNNLEGKYFFDDPTIGKLASSNLTRAKGSPTEHYTDVDWVRAIRHGLGKDGRMLFVMPSESMCHLSDKDLGCLIAFIKTLPPIENHFDEPTLTAFSKILAGAGQFGELYPYKVIDHAKAQNIPHPAEVNSLEHGYYMVQSHGCVSCHKSDFGGGKSPDPVSPLAANISSSGNPGKWTKGQFIETLRSGKTPEGKVLNPQFMPFNGIAVFSDEEIGSIYDYIMSLPPADKK